MTRRPTPEWTLVPVLACISLTLVAVSRPPAVGVTVASDVRVEAPACELTAPAAFAELVAAVPIKTADPDWLVRAPLKGDGLTDQLKRLRPADPVWAQALPRYLAAGSLECRDLGEERPCGGGRERAELPPDAGSDNPCLRRQVVLWVLGELGDRATLVALASPLLELARRADAELGSALLKAAREEPRLLARMVAVALETDSTAEELGDAVEALTDDDLRTLALVKNPSDLVVRTLMKRPVNAATCRALATSLSASSARDLRLDLVDSLARCAALDGTMSMQVSSELMTLSYDDDCRLRARAASVLEKHFGHERRTLARDATLLQQICHHAADLDEKRGDAALAALMTARAQHWAHDGGEEVERVALTPEKLRTLGQELGAKGASLPSNYKVVTAAGGRRVQRVELTREHNCGC